MTTETLLITQNAMFDSAPWASYSGICLTTLLSAIVLCKIGMPRKTVGPYSPKQRLAASIIIVALMSSLSIGMGCLKNYWYLMTIDQTGITLHDGFIFTRQDVFLNWKDIHYVQAYDSEKDGGDRTLSFANADKQKAIRLEVSSLNEEHNAIACSAIFARISSMANKQSLFTACKKSNYPSEFVKTRHLSALH